MNSKRPIKDLIFAHLDGDLTGDELKMLKNWLSESRENVSHYSKVKDVWEASLTEANKIAETEKEWLRFLSKINHRIPANFLHFKTNLQILYRIAAVFIIGLIAGGLVMNYVTKEEPVYVTSIAPKGSISQMVLADSTLVYLNAGSEIMYSPNTKQNKREVFLKGEAWFDVTKNVNNPFIVHTSFYDVNVTGTKFNIKAYEEDNNITTTLEEGEVRIISSENYKLAKTIILKPGEQSILDRNSKIINIKQVETNLFTSWKDNKLIFLNMNVSELIVLLERRYGVDIEVNDPGILKYHYTGTIKNESILEILEIIKHTLPIQYKIEGQKVIVNKT